MFLDPKLLQTNKFFGPQIFAGAARRAGPDSMLILCLCICGSVWDNFSASDWSKVGDDARRR